ncbi:unnamed protein product, partial [Prunus brigantina]
MKLFLSSSFIVSSLSSSFTYCHPHSSCSSSKNSKIRHFLGAAENSNLESSNENTSFMQVVHLRDSYNILHFHLN